MTISLNKESFMFPIYITYMGLIAISLYGVVDLILKGHYSYALLSVVITPWATVQGAGALLGYW